MLSEARTKPLAMQLAIYPDIDLDKLSADVDAARRNYDATLQHRSDLEVVPDVEGAYSYSTTAGSTKSGQDDDLRPDD